MTQPIRLVHASDFHLEMPVYGLAEVPDHLRELLIEAPYHAAEQVFETALSEDVDAVLLAGDILNVDRAGPPAIVLLLDQFARLAERKIPIYWAGGAVDTPDSWPRSVTLPSNVHVFPIGHVESLDLTRAGTTIARIQGTSCPEGGTVDARGFHRDAHGLFTIGVAYGTNDSAGHEGDRVHYMALGGRHLQQTVDEQPGIAHFCGSPQGRGPKETGPHGCTVVTVDETARAKPNSSPPIRSAGSSNRSKSPRPPSKNNSTTASSSGSKNSKPNTPASISSSAGTSAAPARS